MFDVNSPTLSIKECYTQLQKYGLICFKRKIEATEVQRKIALDEKISFMDDRVAFRGDSLVIKTIKGDQIRFDDPPFQIDDRFSKFDEVVREIISDFIK